MALAPVRESVLENGAVMTRAEFHEAYLASADLHHVELIEGVVFMPSPIKVRAHARRQRLVQAWLDGYEALHLGEVEYSPPATVLLDDRNEFEPDAMLYRVRQGRFSDDYLLGAPELVVEVANSSRSRDLHQKRAAYERNGVMEYIVWRVADAQIDWFQLRHGAFDLRLPDAAGVIESEVFPGLRLDVGAMLAGDRARILAALTG